jgi:hypothetical protein
MQLGAKTNEPHFYFKGNEPMLAYYQFFKLSVKWVLKNKLLCHICRCALPELFQNPIPPKAVPVSVRLQAQKT